MQDAARWTQVMAGVGMVLLALSASRAEPPAPLRVADAGVLKFNGRYYLMGVFTNGGIYTSDDLVHWKGPTAAFTMKGNWPDVSGSRAVHAPDLRYVNGRFHLYWNGIGHAVADRVLGPYREPVVDKRFDGEIDPHLFVDVDGTCTFYTVKFTGGNTIYGQTMAGPAKLTGQPKRLLSALPTGWERRDFRINEGPFVVVYRGRYYLLYNANHTSINQGNYAIGCAVAETPLGFTNASKYAQPVLDSNERRVIASVDVLVGDSRSGRATWRYTTRRPNDRWREPDFDDSAWARGVGGFGRVDELSRKFPKQSKRSAVWQVGTPWTADEIYLRYELTLTKRPSRFLQAKIRHIGRTTIWLNGMEARDSNGRSNPRTADLKTEAIAALRPGRNVVAVHCRTSGATRYVDVGLIDPRDHPGEGIVYNCGQPNLVRGPNGFEWRIVYFAVVNGGGHVQRTDRVLFFNRTLHVDGPTLPRTPGYHPAPHRPTFRAGFDRPAASGLGARWKTTGGAWCVVDGEARQTARTGAARAMIDTPAAGCYLIETGVKIPDAKGRAGIIAHWRDADNHLLVYLDADARRWGYALVEGGKRTQPSFPLPADFRFDVYRTLRMTNNGGQFDVHVDDIRATRKAPIRTGLTGVGSTGLYCRGGAVFDGVTYTVGWDEVDAGITGWGDAANGAAATGTWRAGPRGLVASGAEGRARTFKGDRLEEYEFMTQVTCAGRPRRGASRLPPAGRMGVYAVYVDEANWLRAGIDARGGTLTVEGRKGGAAVGPWDVSLPSTWSYNLRAAKLADRTIFWVDGREVLTVTQRWPAAQVGLFAERLVAEFNGITAFDITSRAPQPAVVRGD